MWTVGGEGDVGEVIGEATDRMELGAAGEGDVIFGEALLGEAGGGDDEDRPRAEA